MAIVRQGSNAVSNVYRFASLTVSRLQFKMLLP